MMPESNCNSHSHFFSYDTFISDLPYTLQGQWKQKEKCITNIEKIRHRRDTVYNDFRVIQNTGLIQQDCPSGDGKTEKECDHKASIPIVKPVNGKRRPPFQRITSCFHGCRAFYKFFQRPCDQYGKHWKTVSYFSKKIPFPDSFSDPTSCKAYLFSTCFDPWDTSKQDRQE